MYAYEIVHILRRPTAAEWALRSLGRGQLSFVETAYALSERAHERHLVSCQHDERARDMSGGA
ncbi:hypothetical protein N8077_02920 [Myxococcota bacterium]|nr:hypothetical protein [Myxococcota bacterium]